MKPILVNNSIYKDWLYSLKFKIKQSQIKASISVNTELLKLYWELGKDIVENQLESVWGTGFFENLSRDLKKEFPQIQGFSITNLKYIKRFYLFYSQKNTIRHQLGDEFLSYLCKIPWRHQIEIFTKCTSVEEACFYISQTVENGWSRAVLINMLYLSLFDKSGKAITNFTQVLPAPLSDLAQQTLKNPYNFDFLTMRIGYNERELENALTENITRFLLELGNGFAYIGRQVRIEVSGDEFFIDLLFYHLKLRCYVVIELKVNEFKPEYLGQLGFYVSAVNHQLKEPTDKPTIGLVICKNKNNIVAEYALESTKHPIGISEYELTKLIPEEFQGTLPSIEEIEAELR